MDPTVTIERIATGWLFFLGLAIGSFLNVVIYRLPRGQSVVSPRSRCPKCGRQLPWYENIPVFSWLALGGKCSGCKTPISARYAIVEILTGVLFLACLARFGWSWELVSALTFVTVLVPLTFIDAELWVLPFELTVPGIVLGVLLMIPRGVEAVTTSVIAAVVCFLLYRALEWAGWGLFRKEALGGGDKFLLAMVGAFLGWRPLLGILFLSAAQGAVFGIAGLLIRGRAGPEQAPDVSPEGQQAQVEQAGAELANAPAAVETPPTSTEHVETFTPDFLKPGLSVGKRLALLPWSVFLQPIPDDPPEDAATGLAPEWKPPPTALPFGPWIVLAALEVMLLGPTISAWLETAGWGPSGRVMFG